MIILSGYEKIKKAGVLADENKVTFEIFEDENDLIQEDSSNSNLIHMPLDQSDLGSQPQVNTQKDLIDNQDNNQEQSKDSKEKHKKKRHRFFANNNESLESVSSCIVEERLSIPFRNFRPNANRKSDQEKRREPIKSLPSGFKDENVFYASHSITAQNTTNQKKDIVLQTVFGNVVKKDEVNKLVVKGDLVGGAYYDNIIIEVYDVNGVLINTIRPKTNAGYDPNIMLGDFVGNGLKQIFLGINSGGSGGFGYFYVFDLQNNEIKTLFDYQEFSQKNQYTGEYIDNYKAKVIKKDSNQRYLIDLSLRPKDYLDMIWKPNGQLIVPRTVDISDVNTVFPYYNSSTQLYELIIYQRVTGLFNADSLGYVLTQQNFKDGKFHTFFEGLMIFSQ